MTAVRWTAVDRTTVDKIPLRALLLGSLLAVLVVACAQPIAPSGGPQDETPPAVLMSDPPADAVNVTSDELTITFTERVDATSLPRALSVTPEFTEPLEFGTSRNRVTIRFPEPLRPNTTYRFTFDNTLRDLRGVALTRPITLAFSTGPTINRGAIRGTVVQPDGSGAVGLEVWAYAREDTLPFTVWPDAPDYRTQTDDGGQFAISYLNEQPYTVVALQDMNRNRQPDPGEPFAAPPQPTLLADTTQSLGGPRWYVTRLDTIAPAVRRVRSVSPSRHTVQFDESIVLASADTAWVVADSATGQPKPVYGRYVRPGDTRLVYLRTDSLPAVPHRLIPGAVTDSSGNVRRLDTLFFTPSTSPDTTALRFRAFAPDVESTDVDTAYWLPPGRAPSVRFNQHVPDSVLQAILRATNPADSTARVFTAASDDGVTYRLQFTPPLAPGGVVALRLGGAAMTPPDTVYTRVYQRMAARNLGELAGIAAAADTMALLVVELHLADAPLTTPYRTARPDSTGAFRFAELPAQVPFRFRAFLDRNGNGQWDGGQLLPYRPAEPFVWQDADPVRARFEVVSTDTLFVR